MAPPVVLDLDGTLTRPDETAIDPRALDDLRAWPAPVVIATGKAFPYPIGLCNVIGIPHRVIAENGGIVCVDADIDIAQVAERIEGFVSAYRDAGKDLGWDPPDLVNRWRETEVAIAPGADRAELTNIASRFDLEVVDSGYAYHVKDPTITKGAGLERAARLLGIDLAETIAIGDSENDVSTFERVGTAYAVANADAAAIAAADEHLDASHYEGTRSVLSRVGEGAVLHCS